LLITKNVESSAYKTGLIEGYHCIQLTIEDGGENDNDGLTNSEVLNLSGVAETRKGI